jgi:hypothetical protein
MKTYFHISADGYVKATTTGDVEPDPLPDCTVVEGAPIDGDFWHPYRHFHWGRKAWEDRRTLAQHKLMKWVEIKAERAAREYGTYTTPQGQVVDIDAQSQARILSTYSLAVDAKAAAAPFSVVWTLADDSEVTLNANQMIAFGKQVMQYISGLYDTARGLRAQIVAASTVAEVEAIQWS